MTNFELSSPAPEQQEIPEALGHHPTVEDWVKIQGGQPTLWLNDKGNNLRVVHVYENSPNDFSGSGKVTDTIVTTEQNGSGLTLRLKDADRKMIIKEGADGHLAYIPAFMLYEFHGKPCETRSRESLSKTLPSEERYSDYDFEPNKFEDYKEVMRENHIQVKIVPRKDSSGKFHYSWITIPS